MKTMNRFPAGAMPRAAMADAIEKARQFGALIRHPTVHQCWTVSKESPWRTHARVVFALIATGAVKVTDTENYRPTKVEPS